MDLQEQLRRFLAPLTNRVRNMVVRGIVKMTNDDKKIQQIQASLLAGELKSGIEHYQNYGFTSNPLPGMETAIVFCGGDRSNGVIVGIGDRQFRLKSLKPGEVAIYTDEGDFLKFERGRKVTLNTLFLTVNATQEMVLNAQKIAVTASEKISFQTPIIQTSGDVCDKNGTMQSIRDTFNIHAHPGDSGGQTGTPTTNM